mmetsp:Transcript_44977/g.89040  ORF Transcript_44977/g.89040 Transcript_44977/m.89040 type:complete len:731 (+) Transcript_44977:119-2311(+)
MVAITALSDGPRNTDAGNSVCIAPLEQLVHTLRTKVTSWHHNVAAALSETFSTPWRPTSEPVWLLGLRFDASAKPSGGSGGAIDDACVQGDASPCDASTNMGAASSSVAASGADGNCPSAVGAEGSSTSASSPEVSSAADGCHEMPQEFVSAWAQISRMTYRQGFAPMYRCVRSMSTDERRRYIRLTSDAGWGCMIRVGQMLLATVLKRHYGVIADGVRTVHAASGDTPSGTDTLVEGQFLDSPCPKRSPFSIFGFVRAAHGREVSAPPSDDMGTGDSERSTEAPLHTRQLTQKLPGDWFGPTTISETIAALVERSDEHRRSLVVYLDTDGVLYEDEVRALAMDEELHGLSPQHPLQPASGVDGWRPSIAGSCSHRDSDDEFMVVSTPSMSPASPQFLQLSTAQSDGGQLSPALLPDACCDMAESFQELQPGLDLLELQLPPPAVGLEEPSTSCSAPVDPAPPSQPARSSTWKRAVLLLFPLQLGLEKCVSRASVSALLRYFELSTSLGAMGGRPRMAHFFVGRQGRELLYVDPHVVQPAAISSEDQTFHNTPTVQSIPVEHIDSSISFAFYCRSEADLTELLEGLRGIDASEDNAPIHSEPTRPYALRNVRACGTPPTLWCDDEEEHMGHSFTEVRRCDEDISDEGLVVHGVQQAGMDSTAPPSPHEGSSGETAGAEDCVVDARGQDNSSGGVVLRSGGRVLCVGAPWAGGTWAEVEEENSIVVEAVPA